MAKLQEWGAGDSLFSSWEDEANILRFESNRIYNLRLLGGSLLLKYAWIPFIKKGTKKVKLFPQMIPSYDHRTGEFDSSIDDPILELDGIMESNMGVGYCIDVDALFENPKKTEKVIRLVKFGPREGGRIKTLSALNRNNTISDYKFGRIVQVIYDADSADPANKFQLSLGEKLPVKNKGDDRILVRIPEDADSNYAGKKFEYRLDDIAELVYPQSIEDIRNKLKMLKVEEAIEIRGKKDWKKAKSSDDNTSSSSSKRSKDKRKGLKKDLDEYDDDELDDSWDEDEDREEKKKRKQRKLKKSKELRRSERKHDDDEVARPSKKSKKKVNSDDDWDDNWDDDSDYVEEKREKRKKKAKDDWDDDEEKPKKKSKKRKNKKCFGKIGSPKSDDCTQCIERNACIEETRNRLA